MAYKYANFTANNKKRTVESGEETAKERSKSSSLDELAEQSERSEEVRILL